MGVQIMAELPKDRFEEAAPVTFDTLIRLMHSR